MPAETGRRPDPAVVAWLQTGFQRQKSGDYRGAAEAYRRSVELDPRFHPGWANLGIVLRRLGQTEEATDCYRRALDADGGNPGLWGNLGNALRDLNRHDDAISAYRRSLELRSDAAQVWRNLAIALEEAGDYAGASLAYDRAAFLSPGDPGIQWQRCLARISAGDFSSETWRGFEHRWAARNMAPLHGLSSAPRWRGEHRTGRSLLVASEQGFGDTLLTLRFLTRIDPSDGPVIFLVQPALKRLVEPTLSLLGIEVVAAGLPAPAHDLVVPIMDLVGICLKSPAEIPPPLELTPDTKIPATAERLLATSRGRLQVGIVWSGDPGFSGNARRAVSPAPFRALSSIPEIDFFSLQMGSPRDVLGDAGDHQRIPDLTPGITDFADTAAILQRLDLLVSTDTSIVHLAGGLGTPVWNLLHAGSYSFYFRDRADSPWYPSMRLFRQPRPGDWESVFAAVRTELLSLAASHGKA